MIRRSIGVSGAMAPILLSFLGQPLGASQQQGHQRDASRLGTVHFSVSCSPAAQSEFNRAVALLHHMTYPQARAVFERVADIDPTCAMAHWGVAMTLFHPLWPTRPGPEELRHGWYAVQRAQALEPPTSRERLFVAATEAFFRDPETGDYWTRIRRWETAMAELYDAFPGDRDAAAFYALAHLATAPQSVAALDHNERAAEILGRIYEEEPTHPGASHYIIHANDAAGREGEALVVTRGYGDIAPNNPHALHMPTHIFVRLGEWRNVIAGNRQAAAAALEHPAGPNSEWVWDEYPHAIEYMVYAYLQRGEDDSAAAALRRLQGTGDLQPSFKTAFHLASLPARLALERKAWSEAAALPVRQPDWLDWDLYPWPEAITWFARGVGAARGGDLAEAQPAIERLAALQHAVRDAGEELFARQIEILRLEVRGWVAYRRDNAQPGVRLLEQAAELERATPKHAVTPAPILPAYELLGDLLMELGQARDALVAYQRSLQLTPRRFNSLLGAARAAQALGDQATARRYYTELLDVAGAESRRLGVIEARGRLSGR